MLEKTERQNFLYRLQEWFGSDFTAVFFLIFGVLCFIFDLADVLVISYVSAFILTLVFCKRVNNIFAYLFYVPFFISTIALNDGRWSVFIPVVVLAAVTVLIFTAYKIIDERSKINLGKMFYPLIAFTVAMVIGGAVGRFNVTVFFVILGFCIEIFCFYLIAINCTENLSKSLAIFFIVGGIFVFLCYAYYYIDNGIVWKDWAIIFTSAQNINTGSIFIALGIAGCLYLGAGKKNDYLYALLSIVMFIMIVITQCRTVTAISAALLIVEYVLFFVYSENKRIILCVALFFIAAVSVLTAAFFEEVKIYAEKFLKKGSNGGIGIREDLWQWCFDRFKEYPYFGYGYICDDAVPTIVSFYPNLVLAHNTVLHWLTVTGVVGTSIAVYFYCGKYYSLFSRFNKNKIFHTLCILTIALSGTFDQSPTMDIFVLVATVAILAASEKPPEKGFISNAY